MLNILDVIFLFNLSLLFVHEMDAIRYQEWKMFFILKDMDDNKAYNIFLLLHIPLYTVALCFIMSSFRTLGFYIIDIFLIVHLILHICFLKNKNNQLNNKLSMSIIVLMAVLSVIHLIGIL